MTTLVAPAQSKAAMVYPEPFSPVEAVQVEEAKESTSPLQTVTYAPVPVHRDGLLVRIVRQVAAFYDWLSGPPMTERDRKKSTLAKAENDRYFYFL